ncbi:MAG: Rpn family recombination-promoting nuclease/putative transposase [Bacteroidota bacterium]
MEGQKAKYINPYTDFGFKKLFGEEGSKELLIDFLNQLLPSHHQIADLDFRNTEIIPDLPYERKAFFDIHCSSVKGERFIVEMQKAKVKFFKDRSLFYTTFPIREKAEKGDWDFRLEPIYFVAILDFEYDEEEEKRKFYRDVALKDQDGDILYDKLHFKFLQMPLFNKSEEELSTRFDKWCYFLKHLENFDRIPAILNEPIFQKAFNKAELANMTPQQRDSYTVSLLNYIEFKSTVETAVETAIEETKMEIVKNMIRAGYDDQTIGQLTNVSKEEIQRIRKRM